MKQIFSVLLVFGLILTIAMPLFAASPVNNSTTETALVGGATPLGVAACAPLYYVCMGKAEGFWDRMVCAGLALGCIALV